MINRTILQGRLTHDPELRTTQSGVSVCSFRVAWSEKRNDHETKLFLQCTAWRGLGEMVSKYFTKGQEIVVEGKLSTRDWEDRDGNKRSVNELTVDGVSFCGPKRDGASGSSQSAGAPPSRSEPDLFGDETSDFTPIDEDDLPFN